MPYYVGESLSIYYEVSGDGKPIVFIHGAWISHKLWLSQRDFLVKLGYQVILYDVRGHGKTGPSKLNYYSIELFAGDLYEFLEGINLQKPVICGLSMGGMIAQCYGAQYPDKISALILCDTAASTALTLSDKLVKYILAPKWMFTGLVKLFGIKRYTDFVFWFAKVTKERKWVGQNPEIEAYEKSEMINLSVSEYNKIFSALYDFSLQPIEKINVPVLIINGEFESRLILKHGKFINSIIPQSHIQIINNAGHASNLENPEAFNNCIYNFFQKTHIT